MVRPKNRLLLFVFLLFAASIASAASDEVNLSGTLFQKDGLQPLTGATIRFVHVGTGALVESSSNDKGCYNVTDLKTGTYSVAVSHGGSEFLLPDKLTLEPIDEEDAYKRCFSLGENGILKTLPDERCVPCKKFRYYLPVAVGAAAAAAVVIGREVAEDEAQQVISPSQPGDNQD